MHVRAVVMVVAFVASGCAPSSAAPATESTPASSTSTSTTAPLPSSTTLPQTTTTPPPTTTTTVDPHAPPDWLGTRPLPLRPDGFGEIQPTPPELEQREFRTVDLLPPPTDENFASSIGPPSSEVLRRSTWTSDCPVSVEELAYVTVAHWGFDGGVHTGEVLVHADHAAGIVEVFEKLHRAQFPIEQMRIISPDELTLVPTGDGNTTTAFVCRPVVGSTSWSMHASGLAIDINPFHNPYVKGDVVLPELASTYTDRANVRPGMIVDGGVVTRAFADIGWHWGGGWSTLTDPMHFSVNNR